MIGQLPRFTFFPYTTLFRSNVGDFLFVLSQVLKHGLKCWPFARCLFVSRFPFVREDLQHLQPGVVARFSAFLCLRLNRSEEHTSELQSRQYLVCRLLLEKKK